MAAAAVQYDVDISSAGFASMISNGELFALSRRIRGKSALLLDTDLDFALDLMKASLVLEDLATRQVIDAAPKAEKSC
jgi:hypothetical protein